MRIAKSVALAVSALVVVAAASCTGGRPSEDAVLGPDASVPAVPPAAEGVQPADHGPPAARDGVHAESSRPFSELPVSNGETEEVEHEPLRPDWHPPGSVERDDRARRADPAVQSRVPVMSMPATLMNFAGQGRSNGGPCTGGVSCSTPPDTNGAVGPKHFVQSTNINGNAGIAIWDKSGTLLAGPKHVNALWNNYTGLNPGNSCASHNDGDPVVVYDQLADRWFITQFSLPNSSTNGGPSYQCVAVSKTGDPTGAYWLYDFKYNYSVNDYGKFGIWPDAYYATFNMFDASGYKGADFCAYDRSKMLAGTAETAAFQQCFFQAYGGFVTCPATEAFSVFGALPVSLDGPIPPPNGAPGYFLQFDYSQCGPNYNQLDLWSLKIDWTTPSNSALSAKTVLGVQNFTPTCFTAPGPGPNCIPQPGTTTTLDGLDDRVMFRFGYRNFGTFESLLVNHSVNAGAVGGIRWYEIRSPSSSPSIFQQGTYAPGDTNWRWMGSIAQDQAQDFALGFGITSSAGAPGVAKPSIGWTGRVSADPVNTMGQGETVIDTGGGVEGDAYTGPPDQHRGRWGDYSNMTVDPTDDCTFWYTQELYAVNAIGGWDSFVSSVKFPSCAANDFTIGLAPATQSVAPGGTTTYTVTVAVARGTQEAIDLTVQNLPSGVTGAFVPSTIPVGTFTSTLTLSATSGAPGTGSPGPTFMVIGKAPSAVHPATAKVVVACGAAGQACCAGNTCLPGIVCNAGTCCQPATVCTGGQNCGTQADGCGGNLSCGTCTAPQTCGGGGTPLVCGCTAKTACTGGQTCGTQPDGCGGNLVCGTCTGTLTCGGSPPTCSCTPKVACTGGQTCGTQSDGCTGTLNCGTCTAPQTCGGGGNPLTCGCTPKPACAGGQMCGPQDDGCGGLLNCGTCFAPQTCGGGGNPLTCGCTPKLACTGGQTCGTQSDGCTGTLNCGTCTAPQTCGGGGNPLTCGCTAKTACGAGQSCGSIADGCGGTLSCGSCSANQTCTGNTCTNNPVDGGVDSGIIDSGVVDSGTKPDSGTVVDSGTPPQDSGTVVDSGSPVDASTGQDSGAKPDGSFFTDASSEGGSSGGTGSSGGCGCRTVETRDEGMPPALAGFGALALLGGLRLRRRRARR